MADDETTDDEANVQSQISLKPGISLSVKVKKDGFLTGWQQL